MNFSFFLIVKVLLNIDDENYEFQFENTFLTNFRDQISKIEGNYVDFCKNIILVLM